MLYRIKSLINLRRLYLDELIFFIESKPALIVIANLLIIPGIYTKRFFRRYLRKSNTEIKTEVSTQEPARASNRQKDLNLSREIPEKPDVLLIVETEIPHCFRYRVRQKVEQLESLGIRVSWISWKDDIEASQEIHFAHVIIFYRVPGYEAVIQLINKAQALNKVTFYDTDDLIFDELILQQNIELFSALDVAETNHLVDCARFHHKAITLCDSTIGSTPALCQQLEKIKPSFLHRNILDQEILDFIHFKQQVKLKRDFISIFYGSGSNTHNLDFELIKHPLIKILHNFKQVRLTIIGPLQLAEDFKPYLNRIDRIDLLYSEAYWQVLQYSDINLAPLRPGMFADSKSEVKWMEAAIMKIPSIVSPTQTYTEIIEHGITAYLAQTEADWYQYLVELISNPIQREQIAEQAYQYVSEHYHPDKAANNLLQIISSVTSQSPERYCKSTPKKNLIFVNVCFPPDGLDDASSIVISQINGLIKKYAGEFKISVFTVDVQNTTTPYQLKEYFYHNIHVTAVSIPQGIDLDWRYHDDQVQELFSRYLQFQQADLVHFHSIQRLTASIMDAAVSLKIPHLVSLYDLWWLCDRQFMINHKGIDCEQYQIDPLVCARCIDNSNNSILRRLSLAEKLHKADKLLLVTKDLFQRYKENGFTLVTLHKDSKIKNNSNSFSMDHNIDELASIYQSLYFKDC